MAYRVAEHHLRLSPRTPLLSSRHTMTTLWTAFSLDTSPKRCLSSLEVWRPVTGVSSSGSLQPSAICKHRSSSYKAHKQLKLLAPVGVSYEPGYEGFVELSKQIMEGRNSKQQQQAVLGVLDALLPPDAPTTFRKIFPLKQVWHLSQSPNSSLPVIITCYKHAVRGISRYQCSLGLSVAR